MSSQEGTMEKVRITVYITTRQQRQLEHRAEAEGFPMAEIIRRALDTYLAWDDPAYVPHPKPQTSNGGSSPG
jgi:hypothetical protein